MTIDPEYLRQHYASLSDEALQAINRAELVEMARTYLDDELRRRQLPTERNTAQQLEHASPGDGPAPDWIDEASEVYSRADLPGSMPGSDVLDIQLALEAAGIPCFLDTVKRAEYENVNPRETQLWRILVPGNLNLHATSVLERDIFNTEFEVEWKTYLEMLSEEELSAMNLRDTFCGLFDRVERVTKTYQEEIARRREKAG